jgi:hypothetical protein
MQAIKPGMTRKTLLDVFTSEGGLVFYWSETERQTLVSRDCPYFKVDVELRLVSRADHEGVPPHEDPRDTVVTISKPYLAFPTMD